MSSLHDPIACRVVGHGGTDAVEVCCKTSGSVRTPVRDRSPGSGVLPWNAPRRRPSKIGHGRNSRREGPSPWPLLVPRLRCGVRVDQTDDRQISRKTIGEAQTCTPVTSRNVVPTACQVSARSHKLPAELAIVTDRNVRFVPGAGLEPARSFEQSILSRRCLPFHHPDRDGMTHGNRSAWFRSSTIRVDPLRSCG